MTTLRFFRPTVMESIEPCEHCQKVSIRKDCTKKRCAICGGKPAVYHHTIYDDDDIPPEQQLPPDPRVGIWNWCHECHDPCDDPEFTPCPNNGADYWPRAIAALPRLRREAARPVIRVTMPRRLATV